MGKRFQITFESLDLGQALDGLRARREAWSNTAEYLRTGQPPTEFFSPEECKDCEEADSIASHYRSIIQQIERQVDEQGGW